jgi:DNA-binding transcriptional LysR family regulator
MNQLRQLVPNPVALYSFEAAARLGSFTRAAEELGVSQAAVSYAVRRLEDSLGTSLFLRRHRRVALTAEGERFFADVAMGLAHIRGSALALQRRPADQHVTLAVSTAFANYWMVPRLAEFRARHPLIDLRLQTTDKDVELPGNGMFLGIRRGSGHWPGYGAALLAAEAIYPVASPRYLESHGPPRNAAELKTHTLIHLEEPVRPRPTWADWFRAQGVTYKDRLDGLRLNDYALVIQAAIAGEGIAFGWHHIVSRLIEQGLLVRLLSASYAEGAGFHVVWPETPPLAGQAAEVRDWLIVNRA